MTLDEVIAGLSAPQHWYMKYGFYRNSEGCWGVDRALIRKGLKEPSQIVRLTELGKQVREALNDRP